MRVINPCVSHMPLACPPDWHASLVGSTWAVYVRRMTLIVLSVEFMFPSTSFWGKPWRFGTAIAFSASSVLFQVLPFPYWAYKSMSFFGLTKQLTVFPFLISGLLWKIGDAGHRSPYLSHAKRAPSHLSYIPVEETERYYLIKPFLCYWISWTESPIAYRCNIGPRCRWSIHVFLTCHSLALPIDMPRWWGPKELFMLDGFFWFTQQYSNVSSDVFLR